MLTGNKTSLVLHSLIAVFAVIAFGAGNGMVAAGQPQYETLPIDERFLLADREIDAKMADDEKNEIRKAIMGKGKVLLQVSSIMRGSPPEALKDDQAKYWFDLWYKEYYFASLTHPEHLSKWPEKRQETLKRMEQMPAGAADVHAHLLSLIRQVMLTIAKGNYHPVARYNAMLFIGQLNSKEVSLIGDKSPPHPFVQGLVDALDEFENPKQIDAVRVAALVGIHRHAVIDRLLGDEDSPLAGLEGRIINLALGLVNAKAAPKGRTQGGHDWMRRRAIEILGALGSVGESGKVVPALQAVLGDDETLVSIRCCAAEALGRLDYPANTTVNVADTAKKMGEVVAHACYDEIRRVEAQQKREEAIQDASGGGSSMGVYRSPTIGAFGAPRLGGGAAFDPLAYRIALTRRHIKHRTLLVKNGLVGEEKEKPIRRPVFDKPEAGSEEADPPEEEKSGILALAKAKDEEYVKTVVEHVDFIIGLADDDSFMDLTSLVAELRKKVQTLEQKCGIVVNVDEMEVEAKEAEGLLENPLENLGGLGGIPSVEPPSKPTDLPPGKAPPKVSPEQPGKTPVPPPGKGPVVPAEKTPVAPSPKAGTPTPKP